MAKRPFPNDEWTPISYDRFMAEFHMAVLCHESVMDVDMKVTTVETRDGKYLTTISAPLKLTKRGGPRPGPYLAVLFDGPYPRKPNIGKPEAFMRRAEIYIA